MRRTGWFRVPSYNPNLCESSLPQVGNPGPVDLGTLPTGVSLLSCVPRLFLNSGPF